ncbi:glycosyltransferase family 4 protein [Candidatus Parcubacteria bacterium]|nr:glycosyltransferase family 4 protein [Patescibacteria group bacterium]MCG2694067.1 glycosyltransferase family 4 protein [Candidatus Parcubacteria bacterium]
MHQPTLTPQNKNKEANICIDARALLGSGGIPQYTKHLINNLNSENKRIYLFCNSLKRLKGFESRFLKVFFRVPNKIFNLSLLLFGFPHINKMIEKRIKNKIDLFLLPNINFWKSKGDKKIIIAHDLSFAICPKFFNLRDRIWHWIINPKKLYQSADLIIAVSKNTKEDLMNIFNIPEEKIKVIYPGISVDAGELQNRKGNYILYLANLEPRKNILGLIAAYEKCSTDLELHIAGTGKYKKTIKNRIAKSNKKDKIKMVGYIRESDKARLIYESQLFVYPSFYEGFGFPPLEAQILGVPVVASSTSSMSEVLRDSALLVNPYNINEISKAMEEVLNNAELRNILIEKGWENVKKYSWEGCATKIGEAIDKVIAESQPLNN